MLETFETTKSQSEAAAGAPREQTASATLSVTESAEQTLQSVSNLYNAVDAAVAKQVRENTYATLAAAAGVGFILGGGMRSPFGQVLLRLSVRAFGPPLVSAALHNAMERAQALSPEP